MQVSFNQAQWEKNFFDFLDIRPADKADSNAETTSFKPEEFFFPWKEIDVSSFQENLHKRFINKTEDVAKKVFLENIQDMEKDLENICIAYTGSDGRKEKLSSFSSPLELIFIVKKIDEVNKETLKKIQRIIKNYPELFYSKIEVKQIDEDSLVCFDRKWNINEQKDYRPFPTRALDADYLVGDTRVFRAYKTKFYQEVQKSQSKKRLTAFKNSALRPQMQLMQRSLTQKAVSDLDVANDVVKYNGERIKATKYPLLRPVQYKMGLHVCSLIQQHKLSEEDFLQMPPSTIERIDWLAKKNFFNLSDQQISEIQKAYTAALVWFGIGQKNFEVNGLGEMSVFPKSLHEVTQTINNFCRDSNIFT